MQLAAERLSPCKSPARPLHECQQHCTVHVYSGTHIYTCINHGTGTLHSTAVSWQ